MNSRTVKFSDLPQEERWLILEELIHHVNLDILEKTIDGKKSYYLSDFYYRYDK